MTISTNTTKLSQFPELSSFSQWYIYSENKYEENWVFFQSFADGLEEKYPTAAESVGFDTGLKQSDV